MQTFSEWYKERIVQESSLGLKRRERVARGLAKRFDRAAQIYADPHKKDSNLEINDPEVSDEIYRKVLSAAGRHVAADQRMQDRSKARIADIARGDKIGRQMQAGVGNVDKVRSNLQASSDALDRLGNIYATDAGTLSRSNIGQKSAELSRITREKELERLRSGEADRIDRAVPPTRKFSSFDDEIDSKRIG